MQIEISTRHGVLEPEQHAYVQEKAEKLQKIGAVALSIAAEILASVPSAQIQGFELAPDQTLYAVHRADGERLAVLTDRDSAVAAALAHELAPVSVH